MNTRRNEISLVQMFWRVLLGWRVWLAAALALAVLFPAARYALGMRTYEAAQQADTQEYVFTDEERKQVDSVLYEQRLLEKYEDFYENSVLMDIDPYHEKVLYLQYYADSSEIAEAYAAYAANALDEETIWSAAGADTESRNYNGLITVDTASCNSEAFVYDTAADSSLKVEAGLGQGSNTFCVRVIYTEEAALEAVSDSIKEQLAAKTADITEQIGAHKLILIAESVSEAVDEELAAQQASVLNRMSTARDEITTLESTMTETQLAAIEQEKSAGEETAAAVVRPTLSVRDIVLGFIMGAFLAAAALACAFVLSSKLQDTEEIAAVFGLREFAVLPRGRKTSGITGLILKLKNSRRKQLTFVEALSLAASNIALCCKNEGAASVVLTGTKIERLDSGAVSELKESLAGQGITLIYGENVCCDAGSMRKAAEAGYAVIVEFTDVSIYEEIEKEIRMLKDQKVEILGFVGVE